MKTRPTRTLALCRHLGPHAAILIISALLASVVAMPSASGQSDESEPVAASAVSSEIRASVPDSDIPFEAELAAVPQTSATSNLSFTTAGQGMWGPGGEERASTGFTYALIDEFLNIDIREDGWIYEFNADLDAGLELGLYGGATAEGGAINVSYPTTATTEAIDYNDVARGDTFVLRTSEVPGAPTMTTDFAEVSAGVGVYGSVGAGVGAYAEVFSERLFDPFYQLFYTEYEQELLRVNLADGNLTLTALDQLVLSTPGIDLGPHLPAPFDDFINLELNVPVLDTGPMDSSFDGDVITNTLLPVDRPDADPTDIDILKLGVDVDSVIGYAASGGSWSSGGAVDVIPGFISVELLDFDVDSFWGVGQTFVFDPNMWATLTFNQPTLIENSPGTGAFIRTTSRMVPVGADIQIVHPGGDLTIDVDYTVERNTFSNETDLVVDIALTPKLLDVDFKLPSEITDAIGDPDFCVWCPAPYTFGALRVANLTNGQWPLEGFATQPGGRLVLPASDPPTLSASVEIDPGTRAVTVAGRISDSNAGETFDVELYWDDPGDPANAQPLRFEGTPIDSGGVTWNPATGAFTIDHTYPAGAPNETFEIIMVVFDSTLRISNQRRMTVTFVNPPPISDLIDFSRLDANEPLDGSRMMRLNGQIDDDGATDTFTLEINWGDPNSPNNIQTIELGLDPIDSGGIMWDPGPHTAFGGGRMYLGGGYYEIDHEYLGDDFEERFLVTGTATDNFDQSSSDQAVARFYAPQLEDVTAPTVTLTTPADGAIYERDAVVLADFECEDAIFESGIDVCVGTGDHDSPVDTSTAGDKTFMVTAFDIEGRKTVVTHSYTVLGDKVRAIDDRVDGSIGKRASIDVGANDVNVPSNAQFRLTGEQSATGTPSINPATSVINYVPDTDERGMVTIDYEVCPAGVAVGTIPCSQGQLTIVLGLGSETLCKGQPVTIDMNTNGGFGAGTEGDDVILGTPGNDAIDGFGGDDIICGGDGNDSIQGGPGNDSILGEGGNDKLFGAQGFDVIDGGDGDDVIHGNRGDDRLGGGAGDDRIFGYAHDDVINGGPGNDRLHGNFGDDLIDGGEGDDRIFGYGDEDVLDGGIGNDLISGNFGDDTINGGEGNDVLYGADGDDTVNGGAGDDFVNGNSLNDTITGGPGNDTLDGGINNDTCDGNAGTDTAVRCETIIGVP